VQCVYITEGTPGSSPTQQYGLIPIVFPDKESSSSSGGRENLPKGHPISPAFASFKMGFVGSTSGGGGGPLSSGHSKSAALQASHKARSFSAFALNASTGWLLVFLTSILLLTYPDPGYITTFCVAIHLHNLSSTNKTL
jgi:hypothetical protein